MKKIYFLLIICLVTITSIQAQRTRGNSIKTSHLPIKGTSSGQTFKGPGCDTLLPFSVNDTLTLYGSPDFGFVSGTNTYDDKEKANYFDLSGDNYSYVTGAQIYFAYANSAVVGNLSKNVLFKVYADNNGVPGDQIGSSVSVPLSSIKSDVDGNFLTSVTFPSALALPSTKKFYISVDISNFTYSDDSIAIYSTQDSSVVPGIAWERWNDDSWNSFSDTNNYGLNVALVILPFVSTSADACGVLPVNLLSFDAARKDKDAVIGWKVANEINMKGYELEKSENNNIYKLIKYLPANNDSKNVSYSFTDVNAFSVSSNIQYRLKQLDNDGKIQYSKIVTLKAASAINKVLFANPFNGSLRMQLNLANASNVAINIYDVKGNLVGSEKPAVYSATSNSINLISTSTLKPGMYIIKLSVGSEQLNYKVIKR